MNRREILRMFRRCAKAFGLFLTDLRDCTLRECLADVDRMGGYPVFWGCFTDADLDAVL